MADERDVLAREVDEELRREQLLKLWQQYGTYVVAAVALIIAGVGGAKFYQHRSAQAAEASGARFASAAREAQKPEGRKSLEDIAANAPAGYATLARLRLAAADRSAGKTAEAAAAYEAIAKGSGVDPLLADYARLQAAVLKLDSEPWTGMQNRLNGLTADSNAWRFSARELLGLAAYKAGKTQEARQEFEKLLGDNDVPPSIAERTRVMMAMLTEKELAAAAPVATEPATPVKSEAAEDAGKDAGKKAPGATGPKAK